MAARQVKLAIQENGGRLDSALARQLPQFSRATLQDLIRSGKVTLNGATVRKPSATVSPGDRVTLRYEPEPGREPRPERIELQIVYEDADLLLVNKPAGLVVHPAPGHPVGTLVNALLAYLPDLWTGDRERPGIVHRLDKDTSGLIAVAKHPQAWQTLQRQFKSREVRKQYLGLVDGAPPTAEGEVQGAIGRDPRDRKRFALLRTGSAKSAVTRYHVREVWQAHALLVLEPITGRTHQLRIHMKALGCPIVGDRVYGLRRPSLPVDRQMLHAWRLELRLPSTGSPREFEAPVPRDLEAAIQQARQR